MAHPIRSSTRSLPRGFLASSSRNHRVLLLLDGFAYVHGEAGLQLVRTGDLVVARSGVVVVATTTRPVRVTAVDLHPEFVADQLKWAAPPSTMTERPAPPRTAGRGHPIVLPGLQGIPSESIEEVAKVLAALEIVDQRLRSQRLLLATKLVLSLSSLVTAIDGRIAFPGHGPVVRGHLRPEVLRVVELIQSDIAAPWTNGQLARAVSLSESALRRAFESATGLTPRQYLHQVRLAHLETLLTDSGLTISDASRQVGWSSASYARKTVLQRHGVAPREYRARGATSAPGGTTWSTIAGDGD